MCTCALKWVQNWCEERGYNYTIFLHQLLTLVNSHMPETYLSTSPGQVCQSVSCQVIQFDVTVVQWYCQCMSVIMGHRQSGKITNSIIVCGPAMTSCGVCKTFCVSTKAIVYLYCIIYMTDYRQDKRQEYECCDNYPFISSWLVGLGVFLMGDNTC